MPFILPPLPYALDALAPHISKETLEYHYGKHHATYVNNLNKLVTDTPFATMSLDDVILKSSGTIFNNAAQVWNHTFYWNCLTPGGNNKISSSLADNINRTFGSMDKFKETFTKTAISFFGSGWIWLAKDKNGSLVITTTVNAGNPLTQEQIPLLTCDVWEHAYYIDYRNVRAKYIEAFWNLVNWEAISHK